MIKTIATLFVGGPADGKRLMIEHDRTFYRIPILPKRSAIWPLPTYQEDSEAFIYVDYTIRYINVKHEQFSFFTPMTLSYERSIESLISNYREPIEEE